MSAEAFSAAAERVKQLSKPPDNATKLRLYALYKQATGGDCSGERPGMTDFVGRAKFDAWSALGGVSQADAQGQYIALVEKLVAEDGG